MNSKVYQAGLKFMLCNAVKRLFNGEVVFHHSLDKGIYLTINSEVAIDKEKCEELKKYMQYMVVKDIPFNRKVISKQDAYEFYLKKGYEEKASNVLNISNLTVSFFEFEGQYNYFYSHIMPKSTKELAVFDLYYVKENEIILIYPEDEVINFNLRHKVYESFRMYDEWLNKININYVCEINDIIAKGKIRDLIKKNDIWIDNNLYNIATSIAKENKRIVLIAGPSSSGKTTTSKKLSLYLSTFGINARPISLDDFFLDRDETPLDEEGNKDYECLEAIDLNLFNKTMNSLLNGVSVNMPTYDFISGVKEFASEKLTIGENDVLVVEGLHALNPNLLSEVEHNLCYKIYISPLPPLNVDRHNYVSTSDNRLMRRIVRDFRTRGKSAEDSLASWPSVRKGEEEYIFPYTDECDAIFNTSYIYEIGVLKVYIEPLLYSIKMDSPYYEEARRLLDHLRVFYTIPSEYVSEDNLLREFIGKSSFEER